MIKRVLWLMSVLVIALPVEGANELLPERDLNVQVVELGGIDDALPLTGRLGSNGVEEGEGLWSVDGQSISATVYGNNDPFARKQLDDLLHTEGLSNLPVGGGTRGFENDVEKAAQAGRVLAGLATKLGQEKTQLQKNLDTISEEAKENKITARQAELKKFYSYVTAGVSVAAGLVSAGWAIYLQVANQHNPAACLVSCNCTVSSNATW